MESTAGNINTLTASIEEIKTELVDIGNLISDIDLTIQTVRNLNNKVFESSKIIESATIEQKQASDDSSQSTMKVSETANMLADLSEEIFQGSEKISSTARELGELSEKMQA